MILGLICHRWAVYTESQPRELVNSEWTLTSSVRSHFFASRISCWEAFRESWPQFWRLDHSPKLIHIRHGPPLPEERYRLHSFQRTPSSFCISLSKFAFPPSFIMLFKSTTAAACLLAIVGSSSAKAIPQKRATSTSSLYAYGSGANGARVFYDDGMMVSFFPPISQS